jgi:hypothetical protein
MTPALSGSWGTLAGRLRPFTPGTDVGLAFGVIVLLSVLVLPLPTLSVVPPAPRASDAPQVSGYSRAAERAAPAVVSIVFVTFTTLRTPATLLLALQSRVLSALLRIRATGDDARVTWLALRTAAIGALAAGPVGVLGALVGPTLLASLFGPAFRPSGALAGLTTAGVALAMTNQLVGQASVARGRTRVLALSWTAGLAVAALVLLALAPLVAPQVAPQVEVRVALAFLAGEIVTLGALAAGTRAAGGRPSTLA